MLTTEPQRARRKTNNDHLFGDPEGIGHWDLVIGHLVFLRALRDSVVNYPAPTKSPRSIANLVA